MAESTATQIPCETFWGSHGCELTAGHDPGPEFPWHVCSDENGDHCRVRRHLDTPNQIDPITNRRVGLGAEIQYPDPEAEGGWGRSHAVAMFGDAVMPPEEPLPRLTSLTFVDGEVSGGDGEFIHVTTGVLANGRDDTGFMCSSEHPVEVLAQGNAITVVSLAVPTDSIRWAEDRALRYPYAIAGLRVMSPLPGDDGEHAWESIDEIWTQVHLFIRSVSFAPRTAPAPR